MRKFALSGLVVSCAWLATLAGAETVPQQPAGGTTKVVGDAVIIGDCRLLVVNKQDVPSHRSGQLKWLSAAELEKQSDGTYRYLDAAKQKEPMPANREVLVIQVDLRDKEKEPEGRKVLTEKGNGMGDRRYYERYYLQLIEGDVVERNQKIGQLDDRLARAEYNSKTAKIEASEADVVAAEKTREEALARWDSAKQLRMRNAISLEDYRAAEVTYERYKSEYISKGKTVDVAREEQHQARTVLELHEIRSTFRGMVKSIYKSPGEAVRDLEPVLQIHNLERLRVEGLVDAQYRDRIKKGMKALIEAPRRMSPRTLKGHLQEVTCVAVTAHKDRPLIVSGSEDGTLRVWDLTAQHPEIRSFPSPTGAAFRSVACSPARARGNYVLAGGSDGNVWLFDLDRPGREPLRELKGGHKGAVTMVAFNLDATVCVTSGEDRPRGSIAIWDVATGDRRPPPATAHVGAITAVTFTPANQIVSAARDNTLRLWSAGGDGKYKVDLTLPKRSGDVPNLGVSPDGKLALFDQGKELRLITLPDGKYAGSLMNPTGTSPFTTMALFSPGGDLVLTAGAEGRMQLWRTPADGRRGQEVGQLVAAERSQPTCGAFAANGQFIVTGSRDRLVHVWNMPAANEINEQLVAEVMHVEPAIESGGRQVRIRADIANLKERLLLGDTVTMVILPQ